MKTRDKQNKHKLKFNYIANLKLLGKIWKEHCALVETNLKKADKGVFQFCREQGFNYEKVCDRLLVLGKHI